jgi:hypothetical protein
MAKMDHVDLKIEIWELTLNPKTLNPKIEKIENPKP